MKKIFVILPLLIATSQSFAATETLRYTIFVEGRRKAGEQIVEQLGKGLTKVHYTFKDNGRGPDYDEEITVGKDGFLTSYSVKGTSTYGAIVDEHFSLDGKKAEWRSTSEKGQKTLGEQAFYVPLSYSYEIPSLMIQALAQTKNNRLPLLPSGFLTQKKLDELTVKANGKTQKVQLLAQTGLGLSPSLYWATEGKKPRLFGYIDPSQMWLVEEGWQDNLGAMEARQKLAENHLLADLAKRLQHPMKELVVITNTRVFDSGTAELSKPVDVFVERGKVTAIKPTGFPIAAAGKKIDAKGRVMTPGLYDMHAHINRWEGLLHTAAGITTIRDMGNNNLQLQSMINEIADGDLLAPQIVPAGFLEGDSQFSAVIGFVIKDLDGAKHAVDWYSEHGYPQLKVYNSFPKDLVRDTVAYAHSRGMRVSGHVPAFMRAQDVVDQGFDEIQHINQVLLNFLVTPQTDTRTLDRFYLPAEKVADLDFDSAAVKDFIQLLKKHNTSIDSTLATFDFIKQKDGDLAAAYAAIAEHMPPDIKRGFYQGTMKIPDDATLKRYEKSYAKMIEFVGRMYKNNIPLVAGTDSLAGFTLQSELELYVQAGLTPSQALQVATQNGAKYTRTSNDRGLIAPGKLADLVLFDGDPTKNIGDIRKVALVVSRGNLMYPNEIYNEIGITPFVENPPKLETIEATKP